MNERKVRSFCLAVLAFAVLVRAFCAAGLDTRAAEAVSEALHAPGFAARVLALETGQAPAAAPAEPAVWPVRLLPPEDADEPPQEAVPEQPEPADEPEPAQKEPPSGQMPVFTADEAAAITIGGACSYPVDKQALLTQASTLDFSQPGPKILIVHTHSSEAYTQEAGWEYESSDPLRTENPERSVIRIGTQLAAQLNAAGIETIHDTALNDYPTYDGAYERMRLTIEGYLAQYPSIQMVLDLHRDAASDPAGMPVAFTAEVDGQRCAQLMLVVGTDEGGLTHPGWRENLANALKLQALLNRAAPGLCRDIDLRIERFNQHETPGSLLVEFGCTGNTLAEALRSADYLGQAVCLLAGK